MSENSKIEWTDHTFNPWEGCQKVGPGCDHCYAETRNARFAGGTAINWGPDAPRRRTSTSNWAKPRAWNAAAAEFFAKHGRRQRVFCASLADVFDTAVPVQWRRDLFDLIEATPHLDWLLLTKRIGNARNLYAGAYLDSARPWPDNVWLGATVVTQKEVDRDIPKLLAVPARVRFLSIEPLLALVSLRWLAAWPENTGRRAEHPSGNTHHLDGLRRIDWVIVGGESGPGARPMHPDWARTVRDQCAAAGVPLLVQAVGRVGAARPGEHGLSPGRGRAPRPAHRPRRERQRLVCRGRQPRLDAARGQKAAGRLLDGQQHDGFPPSTP
ncbi:DUF5131 family protein [Acidovorax citrulli]|nr:DUF5131 family protein [Paracidovorax citrulli]